MVIGFLLLPADAEFRCGDVPLRKNQEGLEGDGVKK